MTDFNERFLLLIQPLHFLTFSIFYVAFINSSRIAGMPRSALIILQLFAHLFAASSVFFVLRCYSRQYSSFHSSCLTRFYMRNSFDFISFLYLHCLLPANLSDLKSSNESHTTNALLEVFRLISSRKFDLITDYRSFSHPATMCAH